MEKVKPALDLDKTGKFKVKVRGEIKEVYVGDVRIDTHIALGVGEAVEKQKIKLTLIET